MTRHRTKAARRIQILDAAAKCFAEKGFHEATMDDIVAASGLSKGSLYWHFENKRDLFFALQNRWMKEYFDKLALALHEDMAPSDKLRAIFLALEESAAALPDLVRAQVEFFLLAIRDEEYLTWLKSSYQEAVSMFETVVREGVSSGEFRDVDLRATALQMAAGLDGVFIQREIFDGKGPFVLSLSDLAESYVSLLKAKA